MYLRINSYYALVLGLLIFLVSCKKDEVDFNKAFKRIDIDYGLEAPLVIGGLSIADIIEQNKDSILVVDDDTVKLYVRKDSILDFDVRDLTLLKRQLTVPYKIEAETSLDLTGISSPWAPDFLKEDTAYLIILDNDMRLDEMIMEGGALRINVANSFNHDIELELTSASILDESGTPLSRIIPVEMGGNAEELIPLDGYTITTNAQTNGDMRLELQFAPTININPSDQTIQNGDKLDIDFTFEDINDYEIAYGFFGHTNYDFDTIITVEWDDLIEGLSGTFNATNPKLFINYTQSFGVQVNAYLNLDVYHDGVNDVTIERDDIIIKSMESPTSDPLVSSVVFTSDNVDNFDKLIALPVPDSVAISTVVSTNVGIDPFENQDFLLKDSRIIMDLEVELPLEFSADLTYRDSMNIADAFDFDDPENINVEYANLHYKFENNFPFGFKIYVELYDSISNTVLNTIYFSDDGEEGFFIMPAKADANGVVQEEDIVSEEDFIALDDDLIDDLFVNATHAIVVAKLQTYDIRSVKILASSYIDFQFSLDAKVHYTDISDEN